MRHFRNAQGLTQEALAYGGDAIAKGHLSDLEKGLLRPIVHTLKGVADRLNVQVIDLMNFPEDGARQMLIELTRRLSPDAVNDLLRVARERLLTDEIRAAAASFKPALPTSKNRYVTCLPLYSLDLAAGGFAPGAIDPSIRWVVPRTDRALSKGMFVARVVGRSMEPRIPDGAYCIFVAPVRGDPDGRTVLVQQGGVHDSNAVPSYTVKRFHREGTTAHPRVRLLPDNDDYPPIELHAADDADLRVVAEFLEVLPA